MEISEFITNNEPTSLTTSEDWELPLAQGGTSMCYKYLHGGRMYFKKTMREEYLHTNRYRAAYRKEYSLGFIIDNPYIVKYQKIIDTPDECTLLLDYIEGQNLQELLTANPHYFDKHKTLDTFVHQLLSALKYMHNRQIIHMDINPTNIMISKMSGDVKVVDLGFCYSDSYQDTAGSTQAYSASEIQNGNCDFDVRTDIYAFGRILQYIQDNSTAALNSNYKRVMNKCLAANKTERFSTINEIIEILFLKARRSKLMAAIASVALLISLFFITDSPRRLHHFLYGYDIIDNSGVTYDIVNKDSMTCCSTGYIVEEDKRHPMDYGHVIIPEYVSHDGDNYKIIEVGDSAFKKNLSITMVSFLPKHITIGREAFWGAENLEYATFAGEALLLSAAFSNAWNLRIIDYPKNLTAIPYLCFYHREKNQTS